MSDQTQTTSTRPARSLRFTRFGKNGRQMPRRPRPTTEEEDLFLAAELKRFGANGPDDIWRKASVWNLKFKIEERLRKGNPRPLAFLAREEAAILG